MFTEMRRGFLRCVWEGERRVGESRGSRGNREARRVGRLDDRTGGG